MGVLEGKVTGRDGGIKGVSGSANEEELDGSGKVVRTEGSMWNGFRE